MRRRYFFLSLLAVVLVLGLSVGHAWSYFTDNTMAEGSVPISVKPDTKITEDYDPGIKRVVITNLSTIVPVWVRARAYVPSMLNGKASGTNWTGSDNSLPADDTNQWFVYGKVLAPGKTTEDELTVTFELPRPEDAQDGDEFNVVVLYECIPVSYNANGEPLPANWND